MQMICENAEKCGVTNKIHCQAHNHSFFCESGLCHSGKFQSSKCIPYEGDEVKSFNFKFNKDVDKKCLLNLLNIHYPECVSEVRELPEPSQDVDISEIMKQEVLLKRDVHCAAKCDVCSYKDFDPCLLYLVIDIVTEMQNSQVAGRLIVDVEAELDQLWRECCKRFGPANEVDFKNVFRQFVADNKRPEPIKVKSVETGVLMSPAEITGIEDIIEVIFMAKNNKRYYLQKEDVKINQRRSIPDSPFPRLFYKGIET